MIIPLCRRAAELDGTTGGTTGWGTSPGTAGGTTGFGTSPGTSVTSGTSTWICCISADYDFRIYEYVLKLNAQDLNAFIKPNYISWSCQETGGITSLGVMFPSWKWPIKQPQPWTLSMLVYAHNLFHVWVVLLFNFCWGNRFFCIFNIYHLLRSLWCSDLRRSLGEVGICWVKLNALKTRKKGKRA